MLPQTAPAPKSLSRQTRSLSGSRSCYERLAKARDMTDSLFQIIDASVLTSRPIPERHRIFFYIGHLEAFDMNLLKDRISGVQSFNPAFDKLFAFGIDPVAGSLPTDRVQDWPDIEHIYGYVNRVREVIDGALQSAAFSQREHEKDVPVSFALLLNAAIEHRLMHGETLAYMLHQIPTESKSKPAGYATSKANAQNIVPSDASMIPIPAGDVRLGYLGKDAGQFAWDNEFSAHWVELDEFHIDRYPVTNARYLEFVRDGGYRDPRFWSPSDWAWRTEVNLLHPLFWKPSGKDEWTYRGMFEEIPLTDQWPVYVSHAEASAYARWSGKRLPTEAQWQRAAYGGSESGDLAYPWGEGKPALDRGNFDQRRFDPLPVNAHPEGSSPFGVQDMLGNGWEWTSSEFAPFEGFLPYSFYPGYSADFFDGQHYVVKGGSAQTAACMLRRSFRNWFQPHYRYAYTGFRCVSA